MDFSAFLNSLSNSSSDSAPASVSNGPSADNSSERTKGTSGTFFSKKFEDALLNYYRAYYDCAILAERICQGEYIDDNEIIPVFKGLKAAYNHYYELRMAYGGATVPLINLGISSPNFDLVQKANQLIGEGYTEKNLEKFEQGKWLEYCAKRTN